MVAEMTSRARCCDSVLAPPFRSGFRRRGGEGSVTDRESGPIHMQARHYDPSIGRFLQADTLALASFTTQGTNRYLYTENDPVNRTDPTGQNPGLLLFGLLFAGIMGGIPGGLNSGWSGFFFGAATTIIGTLAFMGLAALGISGILFGALLGGLLSAIFALFQGANSNQVQCAYRVGAFFGLINGVIGGIKTPAKINVWDATQADIDLAIIGVSLGYWSQVAAGFSTF